MDNRILIGNIKNNKLEYKINTYEYMEDDTIFLAVDGDVENPKCIQEIKNMYEKYGEDFIYKIDGFFAVYLYDKKTNTLILIKDKMGLKPIYYYQDGNDIYFGRDIIDLVNNYNIKKKINIDALSMYFRYLYINPPETIFKNIYKMENGHSIIIKNGIKQDIMYWDLVKIYNENSKNKITDFNEAKNEVKKYINDFLEKELKYEKNFGVYLSGGIDSSVVSGVSNSINHEKINTFSIGFYEKRVNEAEKSKKVAEYLKTNHHELYITKEKMLETIKKFPTYYTEPFADSSGLATIILNEFAKENGINIALTGDGADQIFCGSDLYDFLNKYQKVAKIVNPFNLQLNNKIIANTKLKFVFGDKKYRAQCELIGFEHLLKNLFKDTGKKRIEYENTINSKNWAERRMIMDLNSFIADRINTKTQVASNKNYIEIRSPFLNSKLIEYSFRIPHNFKYHKKIKKYILKQILYDYIPEELFSNKKNGFTIPIKEWIQEYLLEDIKRLSTKEYIEKQNIFNYDVVTDLINRINEPKIYNVVWEYYIFQIWYDMYVN